MNKLKLLLADDHVLVRAGLRTLLEKIPDIQVVGETDDGHEAVRLARALEPDVILMDIAMPTLNGIDAATQIRQRHPGIQIIILSMYSDDVYVDRALRSGAGAYLLKDSATEELGLALKAVRRGETYLSPRVSRKLLDSYLGNRGAVGEAEDVTLTGRQREVLQLIAEGHTTRNIAGRLNLSIKTVETHRANIMHRLGVNDVAALVRYALRVGLLSEN